MPNTKLSNRSLTIVAMTICDKLGVKLKFEPNVTPWTDGDTIVVPPLRDDLPEETRNDILASLIHECGHVRYTDMKVATPRTVAFQLCNGLEDPRIERKMEDAFLSARRLFADDRARAYQRLIPTLPEMSLLDVATVYTLSKGSLLQGRADCAAPSEAALKELESRVGDKAQQIDQLVSSEYPKCTCTADVWAIAQKIAALLPVKEASDPAPMDAEQKSDKLKKGKGQKTKAKGQQSEGQPAQDQLADASAEGESSDGQEGQSSTDQASGSESASGQTSNGQRADDKSVVLVDENGQSVQECTDFSGEEFRAAVEKACRSQEDSDGLPMKLDLSKLNKGTSDFPEHYSIRGRRFFDQVRQHGRRLGRILHSFVQSTRREHSLVGACGIRAKGSALSRLAVGNPRVFEKNTQVMAVNTAVQIMLDQSGSMDGRPFETALTSALSLFEALRSMSGVKAGLATYSSRINGHVLPLLQFGQRMTPEAQDRIARIGACSGTPDLSAVTASGYFLAKCREERKVVFYITDATDFSKDAADMVQRLQAEGILFVGIVIKGCNQVSEDFKALRHVVAIKSVDELEENLLGLAKRIFY